MKSFTKTRKWLQHLFFLYKHRVQGHFQLGSRKYLIKAKYVNPLLYLIEDEEQYEPELLAQIETIYRVRPEGAFIDVGANIGQTLLKVIELDPDRTYVGFEPQLSGAYLIDNFIQINGLKNTFILPIGLSNTSKIVRFGLNTENDVSASFVDEYRPKGFHKIQKMISVEKGDEIFRSLALDSIAVIKIDVEGAELEVLEGITETLRDKQPYVLFEILPDFLFYTNQELDDITKNNRSQRHDKIKIILDNFDYQVFRVETDQGLGAVTILEAHSRKKFDYIAVPAKESAQFISEYDFVQTRPDRTLRGYS